MQADCLLCPLHERWQIISVANLQASLLQHCLCGALDQLLRGADGQGRVGLRSALETGEVLSDRGGIP